MEKKQIEWVLRIGVAGEFIGHGALALLGKSDWVSWIVMLTGVSIPLATKVLFAIGIMDQLVALSVLIRPMRPVLLWAALWGFWTAILRPVVGQSVWDFVERSANWAAPLALLGLLGLPRTRKEFFS